MLSRRCEKKLGKVGFVVVLLCIICAPIFPLVSAFFITRRKDLLQDHNGDDIHRGDTSADGRRNFIYPRPLKQNSPEPQKVRGIIICTISDLDS